MEGEKKINPKKINNSGMLEFEDWLTENYGFTTNDGIWKRSKITMLSLIHI